METQEKKISQLMVVKSNELIQKQTVSLNLQQQKIILFLISKIKPMKDEAFKYCEFPAREFCKLCGLEADSGKNYVNLKKFLKDLHSKTWDMINPAGVWCPVHWIDTPYMWEGSYKVKVRLHPFLIPYLVNLRQNFTEYELYYTLCFVSKYSVRAYELIKSIHYHELEQYSRIYNLDELKTLFDCPAGFTYSNFKIRCLDKAKEEINEYTDKIVDFEPLKKGKSVVAVKITIRSKAPGEIAKVRKHIQEKLGISGDDTISWTEFEDTEIEQLCLFDDPSLYCENADEILDTMGLEWSGDEIKQSTRQVWEAERKVKINKLLELGDEQR